MSKLRSLAVAAIVVSAGSSSAQSLSVNFATTDNGGKYKPENIVAVWVESSDGTFQKTIGRWSLTRTSHLKAWLAKTTIADVDAYSGATRANHNGTLTANWNLKNKSGQVVPDGTYTIRMEMCDSNASLASQNRQGSFTFVKGPNNSNQSTSGNGFNNVAIMFTAGVSTGGGTTATGGGTAATGGGTAATGGGTAATGGGTAATGGGTAATGGGSGATGGGAAATGGGAAATGGGAAATGGGTGATGGGTTGATGGGHVSTQGCTAIGFGPELLAALVLLVLVRSRRT